MQKSPLPYVKISIVSKVMSSRLFTSANLLLYDALIFLPLILQCFISSAERFKNESEPFTKTCKMAAVEAFYCMNILKSDDHFSQVL